MSNNKSKGSRRASHSSSSKPIKPTESTQTWPPVSFLFVVNSLPVNDEIPPCLNEEGQWRPPVQSSAFATQVPGQLYRWSNGVVTAPAGYQLYQGNWWSPQQTILNPHRSATMFYANSWNQFLTVDGDASRTDMANAPFQSGRWYALSFHLEGSLSRIHFLCESPTLATQRGSWITQLGLTSYISPTPVAEASTLDGLGGNLALIIALVAFSCRRSQLDTVLLHDGAWQNYRWRGHQRQDGRHEGRGMVVTIYYDPDNQQGSTCDTLTALEWGRSLLR